MLTIHFTKVGAPVTACGRDARRVPRTDEVSEANCKTCAKVLAHQFVGESHGRKQFRLVCKGGPWDNREVVFPWQEPGTLSLPIRVGEHVGRYNLNTGHWVPLEQIA